MKKIVLNQDACIGCGVCIGIDPEHFEFDDEGYSSVISQENLDSASLMDAIDACPVAVISLENVSNSDDETIAESSENHLCDCDPCECVECHCHDEEAD